MAAGAIGGLSTAFKAVKTFVLKTPLRALLIGGLGGFMLGSNNSYAMGHPAAGMMWGRGYGMY